MTLFMHQCVITITTYSANQAFLHHIKFVTQDETVGPQKKFTASRGGYDFALKITPCCD
jgi:hypothetical protein